MNLKPDYIVMDEMRDDVSADFLVTKVLSRKSFISFFGDYHPETFGDWFSSSRDSALKQDVIESIYA